MLLEILLVFIGCLFGNFIMAIIKYISSKRR